MREKIKGSHIDFEVEILALFFAIFSDILKNLFGEYLEKKNKNIFLTFYGQVYHRALIRAQLYESDAIWSESVVNNIEFSDHFSTLNPF